MRAVDVVVRRERDHDLELLELDVDGVVVLAEEDARLAREHVGVLLQDQVDVAQRDVLHLRALAEQRDERRGELAERLEARALVGDALDVAQHDLDRREDDRRVRVLQARRDAANQRLRIGGRAAVRRPREALQQVHLRVRARCVRSRCTPAVRVHCSDCCAML